MLFINRSRTRANRLNKAELTEARNRRLKDLHMWSIIREVLSYSCFLWTLYVITYSNRDSNAFLQVNHLRNFFLNIGHSSYDYTKVRALSSRRTMQL